MDTVSFHPADVYLEAHLGASFAQLLQPITEHKPSGDSLVGRAEYAAIKEARYQDDASLPMGVWAREIRSADWPLASRVAVEALRYKSKDLQLPVWLLESRIHLDGFAGVAPIVQFMSGLLERYWDNLYPPALDGYMSYRANVLQWADRTLVVPLQQVLLTASGLGREYSLSDWMQIQRLKQLAERGEQALVTHEADDLRAGQMEAAMSATPLGRCEALQRELLAALDAMALLHRTFAQRFISEPPSLNGLRTALSSGLLLVAAELHRRGANKVV